MTNLQILLDFLDIEGEAKEEAILAYFEKQDESNFTVNGVNYLILDNYELRDLYKDQCDSICKEFKRNNRDFQEILDAIDFEEVVSVMIYDLSPDDITTYDYVGENNGMYIFIDG